MTVSFFSAEVLDSENKIYTKEDDRFEGLKLKACVRPLKIEEQVDEKAEEQVDEKTEENVDEKTEEKVDEKTEEKTDVKLIAIEESETKDDVETLESSSAGTKSEHDDNVLDAEEIYNKIKEWYQEGEIRNETNFIPIRWQFVYNYSTFCLLDINQEGNL